MSGEDLFRDIPAELRLHEPLRLDPPLTEAGLSARLLTLATPNTHLDEAVCFLGAGAYDHYVPAVCDAAAVRIGRALIRPDSPQPLLQLVYELQVLFAQLTGIETVAAPLSDGPTALVEAVRLALAATGRTEAAVARNLHPTCRSVLETRLAGPGMAFREVALHGGAISLDELERAMSDATACVVVEHPNVFGCLEDVAALAEAAHRHGALLVVKVDPLSLALLASPEESGADVAVSDGQALGSPPLWGAASLGLLACRAELAGALPCWRVERDGEGFRSAGTPRAAVRADRVARPVTYLSALGSDGLARVASLCAERARSAQQRICSVEGFDRRFRAPFFKEFVVESAYPPDGVAEQLLESNILGPLSLEEHFPEMEQCLLFAVTERRTKADIDMLHHALDLLDTGDLLAL